MNYVAYEDASYISLLIFGLGLGLAVSNSPTHSLSSVSSASR